MKKLTELKNDYLSWKNLKNKLDEFNSILELSFEDESLIKELEAESDKLKKEVDDLELHHLFTEEYDRNNVILSIHPGAGGTESQDWASMLFRMYSRWAESRKFNVQILDMLPGESAGIKSVTVLLKGEFAYGYLKSEKGVHRLVRISPYDANKRRHTSFASVDVMPEVDETIELNIKEEELKIDTFRASGHGGQGVNKIESAVRITHIPTGIVAICQNERSQYKNKEFAMKILKSRLFKHYSELQQEKMEKIRGEKKDIAWGSQIRSYIFQPYSLVKDHRTEVEKGDVQGVMDGKIDEFIEGFLRWI